MSWFSGITSSQLGTFIRNEIKCNVLVKIYTNEHEHTLRNLNLQFITILEYLPLFDFFEECLSNPELQGHVCLQWLCGIDFKTLEMFSSCVFQWIWCKKTKWQVVIFCLFFFSDLFCLFFFSDYLLWYSINTWERFSTLELYGASVCVWEVLYVCITLCFEDILIIIVHYLYFLNETKM